MTAEIAILTRSAIALAADSAVTVGRERVWKHTNKLFSVSSYNDIGIMIFGSGDYCGISWEIVIKQFRRHIGRKVFDKLKDCSQEFKKFLGDFGVRHPEKLDINLLTIFLVSIKECEGASQSQKAMQRRKKFHKKLDELLEEVDSLPIILPELTREAFSKKVFEICKGLS